MWCDRSIPSIKARARKVNGGIVAAFGDKLPVHYQGRTCESGIRLGSMNGTHFQLHKVSKDDIFDYKGFYENPDNVLQKFGCVPR
jgi:hypothetical protein